MKSLIFDLDGTLWDSSFSIAKAWNTVFQECDLPLTNDKTVRSLCGLPMDEIMQVLQPGISLGDKIQQLYQIEEDIIRQEGALYYGDAPSLLRSLSLCYPVYIVSNCQDGYIQLFLELSGLTDVVLDFECWGRTGLSKGENIRLLMKRNSLQHAIYVGDTTGDEKAARHAGIPFFYAAYGFGQALSPDVTLNQITDLKEHFPCHSNASSNI